MNNADWTLKMIRTRRPTLPRGQRTSPRYKVAHEALWDLWHPHGGIALLVNADEALLQNMAAKLNESVQ